MGKHRNTITKSGWILRIYKLNRLSNKKKRIIELNNDKLRIVILKIMAVKKIFKDQSKSAKEGIGPKIRAKNIRSYINSETWKYKRKSKQ